ncbi:MAG: CPBP family glutamic-type intramembrane protease [Gemmatimonadota bacterium]
MRITPAVRAIFGLELKTLVRDVRTLLMSVVLPVVLIPILLLGSIWVENRRVEREGARTYRYAIEGAESDFARALLAELQTSTQAADPDDAIMDAPDPDAADPDAADDAAQRFRAVEVDNGAEALEADSLDVFVEALSSSEWRALVEEDSTRARGMGDYHDTPVLRVHYRSNRTASSEASRRIMDKLDEILQRRRATTILEAGFSVSPEAVAVVESVNVASAEAVQGARLGRYLSLLLLGLMVLGGSVVATDTLAGEKERGTLATLLTSAASRTEIVTAKLMAIMAVALTIAVVQVVNLWLYLGLGLLDVSEGLSVAVTPVMAGGLLLLYLPAVALVSGILLLTSAYARSYKEAQLLLTPVLLGLVLPTMAPFLPDLSLRSAVILVPLANLSLAARDVLVGQPDWLAVAGAWLVTAGAAVWVTGRSVRALHDESVITGDTTREEFLGGAALWGKRVLPWFAVFWAVKVLLELNVPIEDMRLTALFHVGVVFTVFPLLVIRLFSLDPRQALALRMPHPMVWVGVVLGVPAALLTGTLVFHLANYVIPVPEQLLENFGQTLLPEGIPAWQLILLLSVVPGIAEELSFRGILLYGLRKRFGPVALALVVGLIFGFFHFQIFRIPATAFLGVILTAVTLMTGSIFPAIVWHTLNNALALYLGSQGIAAGVEGGMMGMGGVIALALALIIIWRHRTPYPEMGARREKARSQPRVGAGR